MRTITTLLCLTLVLSSCGGRQTPLDIDWTNPDEVREFVTTLRAGHAAAKLAIDFFAPDSGAAELINNIGLRLEQIDHLMQSGFYERVQNLVQEVIALFTDLDKIPVVDDQRLLAGPEPDPWIKWRNWAESQYYLQENR